MSPPPPTPPMLNFSSFGFKKPSVANSDRRRALVPIRTSFGDSITFHSDSEEYDDVPLNLPVTAEGERHYHQLSRSNTATRVQKSSPFNLGHGWKENISGRNINAGLLTPGYLGQPVRSRSQKSVQQGAKLPPPLPAKPPQQKSAHESRPLPPLPIMEPPSIKSDSHPLPPLPSAPLPPIPRHSGAKESEHRCSFSISEGSTNAQRHPQEKPIQHQFPSPPLPLLPLSAVPRSVAPTPFPLPTTAAVEAARRPRSLSSPNIPPSILIRTSQADSLSDSERHDGPRVISGLNENKGNPKLNRSLTTRTATLRSYQREAGNVRKEGLLDFPQNHLPLFQPVVRQNSKSPQSRQGNGNTTWTQPQSFRSRRTSGQSKWTSRTTRPFFPSLNQMGSAVFRKFKNQESSRSPTDTTERLEKLRSIMATEKLDYYIVPTENARGSEFVAASDKRLEFISGFTCSAGQAIITMDSAYLFTDSRYWVQADEEVGKNWTIVRANGSGAQDDWVEWIVDNARNARIGIDARTISYETARFIESRAANKNSTLVFPPQNLVELIWKDKPTKPLDRVSTQGRDSKSRKSHNRPEDRSRMPNTVRIQDTPLVLQTSQKNRTFTQSNVSFQSSSCPLIRDSTLTLVGKRGRTMNTNDSTSSLADAPHRLEEIRRWMVHYELDYYVVPSEDAHGSQYVAASDRRLGFISGYTGPAGQAMIMRDLAFLLTDSRYWSQAAEEADENWTLVRIGAPDMPNDWIEWLEDHVQNSKVGIDNQLISHEKALLVHSKMLSKNSMLVSPPQNLVDLVWKTKPPRPVDKVYRQRLEFTGVDAAYKLAKLRDWIKNRVGNSKDIPAATLISSLACIAYLLNLRGSDIPFNPFFHAYLFVDLNRAILFVQPQKLIPEVTGYLYTIGVECRDYATLWSFLSSKEWGNGRVVIAPQTSFAISSMITTILAPCYAAYMMCIKNQTEIDCLTRAYLRDGVSFVRFLAWLESKLSQEHDVTEYMAARTLMEYRRKNKHFIGLACKNISASGQNTASPRQSTESSISRDHLYLNDSGAQYYDGTCYTARTLHFGKPTDEICEAYTRVLQGHIAIDSAVFREGTSIRHLDVLARKTLWKDEPNYRDDRPFLTLQYDPQGAANNIMLEPGHVVTNEPGLYLEGKWGIRIKSVLAVQRVKMDADSQSCLSFVRLTCVPIQTRMVVESMLTKEEKTWIKEHNQQCYNKVEPFLDDDKRALEWLDRQRKRGKFVFSYK